jgi:hypothetical protein
VNATKTLVKPENVFKLLKAKAKAISGLTAIKNYIEKMPKPKALPEAERMLELICMIASETVSEIEAGELT